MVDNTRAIIEEYGLHNPDVVLVSSDSFVSSKIQATVFASRILQIALTRPHWMHERVFLDQGGTCVIHGDTLTTLLSLIYAKRAGMRVWHVEVD
jgi:UDP-N-acetylglucosamine 2-epimerase (non-hydrolysing)